ncbi:NADH dehydrogenase [ubiquinone] 1 alpha subcomplex subunit 1-like [Asterias rubens]|nr:NADH dehydrogenase [ubiquinone] 1 alpha subcomplex subunit 1-like [Asterias rubens]
MWYEILPGLAIFAGCLSAVGVVNIGFQKLGNGGKLRRVASNHFEYRLLRRDEMIAGKGYYSKGLEALPDVPLTKN